MKDIWTPPIVEIPFKPFFTRRTVSTIILAFGIGGAFGLLVGWFVGHAREQFFHSIAHARVLHYEADEGRINTPAWAEAQEAILQKALRQAELEAHFERKVRSFTSGHFDGASKGVTIDVQSVRESECQTCANRVLYFLEALKQQQIREFLQPKDRKIDEMLETFNRQTLDLSNLLGESPYGESGTLSANTRTAVQENPALAEAYAAWQDDGRKLEVSKTELKRLRLLYGLGLPSLEILDQPSAPVAISRDPLLWSDVFVPFLKGAMSAALIVTGFLYLRQRIQKDSCRSGHPKQEY